MKNLIWLVFLFVPLSLMADTKADSIWVKQNYVKTEVYIPMRDGVELYTAIYSPKDATEKHPFLMVRTPYSIAPYGADTFRNFSANHWINYLKENYIFVMQDVRG